MRHLLYTALLLVAAALPAGAQTTQRLSASKANDYGVVYRLPLSTFDITLEAQGVIEKPGELARYAKVYLGVDPILEPSTRWKLRSAVITPTSVPDRTEEYLVQFKGATGTYMVLDEQALPLALNLSDLPAAAPAPALPQAVEPAPTVLDAPDASHAITSEMASATSLAKRAELAAARIFEIRETRSEILSGQSDNMPADGAAMQLVLDQLARQEAVLTAMFTGTRQEAVQVRTFSYTPPQQLEADESQRDIVARVSALKGIVGPDDLSGTPVYLNLTVTERGQLPVTERGEPRRYPKGGVAYRIPGSASLTITCDGRTLASDRYAVAQYGVVYGLDPALFTAKKAPSYLIFDPLTGAIRELGTIDN